MIQKRFKLLMAVLAIAFAATGSVKAESWTSGDCTVTLSNDTLYVSGDGKMGYYNWLPKLPWYNAISSIKHAVVGKGVTELRSFVWNCDHLETIDFEEGSKLKAISDCAIVNCPALTTITLPDSVESIIDWAFQGCSSLVSITIPASIKSIGYDTFYGCTNLADIYCYGDPEKLTWGFNNIFALDCDTKVHVLNQYLSKYQEKFNKINNATFVGDLEDNTTTYTLINIPEGWTLTANGRPVTVNNGEAEIPEGANVKLTPATAIINKVKSVTLEDFMPQTTAPTLRTDLVYNGQTQALITAGEVDHGTMLYSTNGTTWSNKVPTATNAGDYNIYYKVVPEGHYLGVEPTLIGQASIAKAKGWITLSPSYTTGWQAYGDRTEYVSISHHGGALTYIQPNTKKVEISINGNRVTIKKAFNSLAGGDFFWITSQATQNYTAASAMFSCRP
ncbi:MAG: leucine-rich repeat domain-containing protein [Prevotella sp.]|nr:leucine-rich repeat domain-containing protein [Prevotella sp.]